jgi:MFS family permease
MTEANPSQKWRIAGSAAAILALIMGQLVNGLSSFFTPLEAAFGWARGDIALINSSGLLGLAVGGIVMGFLADRLGPRRIAILGVLVSSAGFAAASLATSLTQLYAIFFVTGLFGGGAVFGPLIALVGRWFPTGAGLAISNVWVRTTEPVVGAVSTKCQYCAFVTTNEFTL